jgi:hypothetical protein
MRLTWPTAYAWSSVMGLRECSRIARRVSKLVELRASPVYGWTWRRAPPASRRSTDAPPCAPMISQVAEAAGARQTLAKVAKLDAVKQRLWGLELAAPVAAGAAISAGPPPLHPRPD